MTRRRLLKLGAAGAAAAGMASGIVPRVAAQGRELVVGFSIDPGHMDPRVETVCSPRPFARAVRT
jgi:hypothetical protein